ncbi:MAG: hypothetical protein ACUVTB_04005 [Candidatus Bathycorpusculaceae bacterium]
MNKKTLTTALITLLTLTIFSQLIFPTVRAVDVEITSISPTTQIGQVGEAVRIVGTINTTNGFYQIYFGNLLMVNETATENSVNASFLVPSLPRGNYTLTLCDSGGNINATTWFFIEIAHHLQITKPTPPEQLQENATVEISISVTGGEPNTIYAANITVKAPANETYYTLISLSNTTDTGIGNATITYPQDFDSAHTNYTGTYSVSFNETLATETFVVGLTDRTEYHRFQTVDIKAAGYQSEENVTLTIIGENVYYSVSLNASVEGVVHTDWVVPSNAQIGTYMVNITSTFNGTVKTPPDIQNFTVPGFDVNITARNLAEEPVSDVLIRIFENETSVVNATSGSDGLASVKLEIGNYTANAYFKEKKVGGVWINVTESFLSFNIPCNLTNLKVLVLAIVDENEFYVPEVKLSLSPENLTLTPNLNTNITGAAVFHNLLTNENYTLNASRYDLQFNTTTLYGLLQNGNPIAWFDLTIICPTYTLQVNVTNPNANDQQINNALVKIHEVMGGLYFENVTTEGTAVFNSPLGKYLVEVYVDGIKLNETIVLLNESFINLPISCKLYGLNIAIQVVDYFGQPIPNAKVTLSCDGLQRWNLAKSDGMAEFPDMIGGNLNVTVYLPGQLEPYMVSPLYVDSSGTIPIKVERYTMLLGFLVETSHLVMLMIIVVSIIVVLSLEVYRRRRLKPKTSKS